MSSLAAADYVERVAELRLRSTDLYWHAFEREVVALDAAGDVYLSANAAGALLWERLREGTTRGELVELLRSRYGLSPDAAERDVDRFLAQLEAHGLLAG